MRPRSSFRIASRKWLMACSRWLLRALLIPVILTLATLAWLNIIGFPREWTRHWMAALAEHGYHADVGAFTFDILKGVTAQDVKMYSGPDRTRTLLEADQISLGVYSLKSYRQRSVLPNVIIVNAKLQIQTGGDAAADSPLRRLAFEGIHGRVQLAEQRMSVNLERGSFLGVLISGRGTVDFTRPAIPDATPRTKDAAAAPIHPIRWLDDTLRHTPTWLTRAVEQYNRIRFVQQPLAHIEFAMIAAAPGAAEISLDVSGGETDVRGMRLDRWMVSAEASQGLLAIKDMRAFQGERSFSAMGSYRFDNREVAGRLDNSIPLAEWIKWAPSKTQQWLAQQNMDFDFPLRVEVEVSPMPVERALESICGRLELEKASPRGVFIESASASFRRQGDEVEVYGLNAVLGRGVQRGPVTGAVHYAVSSRDFHGWAEACFDMGMLKPVVSTNIANILHIFEFPVKPPWGKITFGGRVGDAPATWFHSTVRCSDFTIRGQKISRAQLELGVTNSVMSFDRIRAERPEGHGGGDAKYYFNDDITEVHVEGTVDPHALATMLGPASERFMRMFKAGEPVTGRVDGRIDNRNMARNDLQAQIHTRRFGWDRWFVDEADMNVNVTGRRVSFSHVNAKAYAGGLSGSGAIYPVGSDTNLFFEYTARADAMDFAAIARASSTNGSSHLRGRLNAHMTLSGYIGPGRGPTVTGHGALHIADGKVSELRVLGPISRWLGRVVTDGFASFQQGDFMATFDVRNSRIWSGDVLLLGDWVSMAADGSYGFDGTLDYSVQVRLLRDGLVAQALRWVTLPVVKLFEFRLTGTMQQPHWRPNNLPAEMWPE